MGWPALGPFVMKQTAPAACKGRKPAGLRSPWCPDTVSEFEGPRVPVQTAGVALESHALHFALPLEWEGDTADLNSLA